MIYAIEERLAAFRIPKIVELVSQVRTHVYKEIPFLFSFYSCEEELHDFTLIRISKKIIFNDNKPLFQIRNILFN